MVSARNVCWMIYIWSCCIFLVGLQPSAAWSKSAEVVDTHPGKPVQLEINKLASLPTPRGFTRVHIVNPDIADLVPDLQSTEGIFIRGKKPGTTQLTIWGHGNQVTGTYEIIVSRNISGLKKQIHDVFPQEHVMVRDSEGSIILTGTISGAAKLEKVLALAEAYVSKDDKEGKGRIINLLQVGGIQQVMLEVRVAEISKTIGHNLGINLAYTGPHGFGVSMLDSLTTLPTEGFPGHPLRASSAVNLVLGYINGNETYTAAIDALQEEGLLQILAKPNLIAQSGQSASFLAGGEFPFPVAQGVDQVTIEWKPFGIGLNFTPTVLGEGKISLMVAPEVSELDFTKTVSFNGFVVPSIDTRRMSTVVELGDNQSFAIAGLLKNYVRESVAKFPLLGDIPILGALFRSTRYQNDETELVVIVTPHLVKPVDGDELPLPTDSFIKPNAFELLLLGKLEGSRKKPATTNADPGKQGAAPASLEGNFGHIIPE